MRKRIGRPRKGGAYTKEKYRAYALEAAETAQELNKDKVKVWLNSRTYYLIKPEEVNEFRLKMGIE